MLSLSFGCPRLHVHLLDPTCKRGWRIDSSSNFQAAQLFSMARLFCLLNVTTIAVVCIWCSAGLTFQDSKLPGFVIKTFKSTDWLHCLEDCNNNDDCVSYNYNRLGSNCELKNFGLKIRCHANKDLVAFHGWIHHTLDPSKVGQNISVLNFFFLIAGLSESTELKKHSVCTLSW